MSQFHLELNDDVKDLLLFMLNLQTLDEVISQIVFKKFVSCLVSMGLIFVMLYKTPTLIPYPS